MNVNPLILSEPRPDPDGDLRPGYMDLRYRLQEDIITALATIQETDAEFERVFGRAWGGLVWRYKMDDAQHALVSMGSLASECTMAVDSLRRQGFRVGVVGVRAYRPFPADALAEAVKTAESVSVFEKDVSYGYGGALANDLKATLFDKGLRPRVSSFIAGLGGRDVTPGQIEMVAVDAITKEPTCAWIDIRGE